MMKVEIYTMENCGYCQESKKLLSENNYDYIEYTITDDFTSESSNALINELGKRLNTDRISVPVVFIDDVPVVGYTRLTDYMAKKNTNQES
jgi:glutaredoxin